MNIVRYAGAGGARVAVQDGADLRPLPVASIAELLTLPLDQVRETVEAAGEPLDDLPQAKIYSGACAIGPGITPAWRLPGLGALRVAASVRRGPEVAWQGETSTAQLHRDLAELVEYLFRYASFPHGVILSTGTGLVPELSFTLAPGDEVRIDIDGVGSLSNVVRPATADWFGWLTPEPARRAPS